jgi:tripartite-type tricarboxylate transporter receptor subunit TctC
MILAPQYRRQLTVCAATVLVSVACIWSPTTSGQLYPNKPIKLVVPTGPGVGPDIVARILAPKLGEVLGQPLVIENRPGAGSAVAAAAVANSPSDGYSLLFGITSTFTIVPSVIANPGYDPISSFTPISLLTTSPFLLFVNSDLGVDSVKALADLARSKPGQIGFAAANGTLPHLAGHLFMVAASVQLTHVPYKTLTQAYPDLVAGRIQLMFEQYAPLRPHVQSGRVKALMVAGPKRHPQAPNVPTSAEAGLPGFEVIAFFGLVGPKGMSPEIVRRLNSAVLATLDAKEVLDALSLQGIEASGSSSEQFSVFIDREVMRWAPIVRASGTKLD